MIFTKKVTDKYPTREAAPWARRFAFRPKCVHKDKSNNTETYVCLGFYETRLYFDSANGMQREYRAPGTQNSWKEAARVNTGGHDI